MSYRKPSPGQCKILIALAAFIAMTLSNFVAGPSASAAGKKGLAKPTIYCDGSSPTSIDIKVCAGADGAPAGFSIQWMTAADYAKGPDGMTGTSDDNTWYTSPSYCGASFSGVPGCSNFNLGPNACITVNIGDNLFDECGASSSCANTPLECDTEYVFRSFAHNVPQGLNKSDFSATITCKTDPCGGGNQGGCTYTQGFWKTHGTEFCIKGNNANEWPQSILDNGLTIGTVHYTAAELCTIFNTQGKQGNKLPALAHQIIAAQLNIANGADPTDAQAALAAADLLIGSLNILTDTYTGSDASTLTDTLTDYNEGTTGPGHCSDEVIEQ